MRLAISLNTLPSSLGGRVVSNFCAKKFLSFSARSLLLPLGLALTLIHLFLVLLGALNLDLSQFLNEKHSSLASVLSYYNSASGAGNGYGFFAPGIDGQLGVRFET